MKAVLENFSESDDEAEEDDMETMVIIMTHKVKAVLMKMKKMVRTKTVMTIVTLREGVALMTSKAMAARLRIIMTRVMKGI